MKKNNLTEVVDRLVELCNNGSNYTSGSIQLQHPYAEYITLIHHNLYSFDNGWEGVVDAINKLHYAVLENCTTHSSNDDGIGEFVGGFVTGVLLVGFVCWCCFLLKNFTCDSSRGGGEPYRRKIYTENNDNRNVRPNNVLNNLKQTNLYANKCKSLD